MDECSFPAIYYVFVKMHMFRFGGSEDHWMDAIRFDKNLINFAFEPISQRKFSVRLTISTSFLLPPEKNWVSCLTFAKTKIKKERKKNSAILSGCVQWSCSSFLDVILALPGARGNNNQDLKMIPKR